MVGLVALNVGMIARLKMADDLVRNDDGFTPAQACRFAAVIAQVANNR